MPEAERKEGATVEQIKENNINNIDIYENDIDRYIKLFCEEQNIENLRNMSQSVWNACLMYVQRHAFPDRSVLKQKENIYTVNNIAPSNCNAYNYILLIYMIKNVVLMGLVN